MKKLATMLAVLAVGTAAMSAGTAVNPGIRTDLRITGVNPEYILNKATLAPDALKGETIATRSYIDTGGTEWEARFQLDQQKLNEMLTFSDENGNPYQPSFSDLPYYLVNYTLTGTKKGEEAPSTMINLMLEWPSQYIYEQVWNYDGELDEDGWIPEDQRNYEPVPFETLWNNPDRCRTFRESEGVGVGNPSGGKWSYYGILPNEVLGNVSYYMGGYYFTMLDEANSRYSELLMEQFDPEEFYMVFKNRILIDFNGSARQVRPDYNGTGELEGFVAKKYDLNEFGDLHLFNTGLVSSELYGDANPFPLDFGELSQFYYIIGDKHIIYGINETAKEFNENDITKMMDDTSLPEGANLRDYAVEIYGYAYADPKFSKDTSLNPEELTFSLIPIEEVTDGNERYALCAPEENGLIPLGIGDSNGENEPWSLDFGTYLNYRNMTELLGYPSNIGWGWNEGFVMNVQNRYIATFRTTSKGKLYYHYDPKDMKVYRELELVGGRGDFQDKVEAITVETAKINAANGVITVVPAENGAVAVYGLDGVCIKNVKANAGEAVNVEAAKGIYVVVVNGASRKVAL